MCTSPHHGHGFPEVDPCGIISRALALASLEHIMPLSFPNVSQSAFVGFHLCRISIHMILLTAIVLVEVGFCF